jgi:uncharacterized protein (TIGR03086 family)
METIADRYDRLADAFAAKIIAVPADRWSTPSPCPDWTALDVVRHVAETPSMFFGFVGWTPPEIPNADDDPAAAFDAGRRAISAELVDESRANTGFDGYFGPTTFAESIDRFVSFDLLIHGWDLARSAGLDETISDDDLERLERDAHAFGDAMRAPQAFGPEIHAPAGADRQTRLLAYLGRRA